MAGKVNAEIVKINESLWLTQNSGGNKLVAYYPVTDVTKVLATEDGVSGDISSAVSTHNSDNTAHTAIQTKIGTDISTHNSDDAAHTAIQDKIGTDIGTHNSDSSAHTAIQTKIGTDIGTHNSDSSAHTAIQTKIGTDIGTHNSSGTAHSDIRTLISNHTSNTSNPHAVTLSQLTGGSFSYDGDITVTGDTLVLDSISHKSMHQRNIDSPTTFFDQYCGSNGLPEIWRKTPADSVPVNIGSPYFTGTHWGVANNTPVNTVKYDGTNPCGNTFRKFTQVTSNELQFGSNTYNRLYLPSSSSIGIGQRYLVTCMVRLVPISGQTPPSTVNLRLYMALPAIGAQTYASAAFNVAIPAYSAAGASLFVPLETTIDINLATVGAWMFCLSHKTGATTQNTNWPYSSTYSDANKPYFFLWSADAGLNTTWECYLADMSLYRIK